MKVIEEGPGWGIEQKCTGKGNGGGGCGSLLLVGQDDIFITEQHCYHGENETYYTFKCSVCGKKTDILETKLPPAVKEEAREKCKNGMSSYQHRWLRY